MKKLIYLFLFVFVAGSIFVACDGDDNDDPKVESLLKTVTLGAQASATDGFYSFNNEQTYSLEDASTNQATIDLLCFYEEGKNDISLSSPGANITDIFDATYDPATWTVQDTTWFTQVDETVFTEAMFAELTLDSEEIVSLFDAENPKRKAKLLQPGDIYAFQTEDNYYGLFRVDAVTQGETGSVTFTYILKK